MKVLKSINSDTVKNSFTCCGLNPESIPIDITCMKEGRPAESACDLIRKFWFDTSKHSENSSNEISEADMLAEDIPELLIDDDVNTAENNTANITVTAENDTTNITILAELDENKVNPSNQNIELCGTCQELPYNIALYFCEQCEENICSECKKSHGLFKLTRDHIISPL